MFVMYKEIATPMLFKKGQIKRLQNSYHSNSDSTVKNPYKFQVSGGGFDIGSEKKAESAII